jgi:ketosteroid isomerase-like protein
MISFINYPMVFSSALIFVALQTPYDAQGQTMPTTDQIKQGYIEHAAMAQLHRWYQLYENNDVPVENALDILTEDIRVKSGLGEAVGHEAYKKRVAELPKTWKNAHRVGETTVQVMPDGKVQLQTQIEYLNEGANPDGSLRQASLKYTTQLQPTDTVLPRFTSVSIEPLGMMTGKIYEDMYPTNRLKSLTHYWLALIEDPKRNLEPFKEVLAKDFRLDFPVVLSLIWQALKNGFVVPHRLWWPAPTKSATLATSARATIASACRWISTGKVSCPMAHRWRPKHAINGR